MSSTNINYRSGVLLVLAAGVCWSSMGLGIRYIEVANVWQILFFRSLALTPLLLLVLTLRARGNPFPIIQRTGLAGVVGGISLVFAFSGGILAIQSTSVANAMFLFAAAPFLSTVRWLWSCTLISGSCRLLNLHRCFRIGSGSLCCCYCVCSVLHCFVYCVNFCSLFFYCFSLFLLLLCWLVFPCFV